MTTCNDFIKLCMKSSTCVYGVYAPYGKKSCLKVTIFLGHLVKSTYVINLDQIISYHSIPKSYVHAYNRLLNIKQSKQSVFFCQKFCQNGAEPCTYLKLTNVEKPARFLGLGGKGIDIDMQCPTLR